MLSRSSLKDDLIAVRDGRKNTADRDLLDRWIAKADQEFWQPFFRNLSARGVPTTDIIKLVLQARRSAVASANRVHGTYWIDPSGEKHRIPGFNEEWAYALPAIRKNIAKKLDAAPLSMNAIEVATFLEGIAEHIRDLHNHYFGFADHLGLPNRLKFRLSRKSGRRTRLKKMPIAVRSRDPKMTQSRKLFTQIVVEHLSTKIGKPFKKHVAALTEIAIPGEALDADDIHNAIKPLARRKSLSRRLKTTL